MIVPFYVDDHVTLFCGDAFDVLPQLDSRSFDLILTDPPYTPEVHQNSKRSYKGKTEAFIDFDSFTEQQIRDLFDLMAPLTRGWLLSFLADDHTYLLKREIQDAERNGLEQASKTAQLLKFVRAGVYEKSNTAPHVNGDRPAQGWESIAMLHTRQHAGKYLWHGKALGRAHSVFTYPFCTEGLHKTQKPLALIEELIALFTNPRMLILDPCAGSGTTLRAAKNLGRRAVGIELSEKRCVGIVQRLAQNALDLYA